MTEIEKTIPTERDQVEELFNKFAIKNNGESIEPKEFHDLLETIGIATRKPQIVALFSYFEDSAKLSKDNFLLWWEKQASTDFSKVEYQFKVLKNIHSEFEKFDKDKSGNLDPKEMKLLLIQLLQGDGRVSIDDCLKELDKNGDGEISFHELASVLKIMD